MPTLSQGPFIAHAVVSASGWSSATNVEVDDGASFASFLMSPSNQTNNLIVSWNQFSLPGNTISLVGFQFEYKGKGDAGGVADQTIQLYDGSGANGNNKAVGTTLSTTLTTFTFGNSSDNWSSTVSIANVNSGNFGIFTNWQNTNASLSKHVFVDAFYMTVWYTTPNTKFFFMGGQEN